MKNNRLKIQSYRLHWVKLFDYEALTAVPILIRKQNISPWTIFTRFYFFIYRLKKTKQICLKKKNQAHMNIVSFGWKVSFVYQSRSCFSFLTPAGNVRCCSSRFAEYRPDPQWWVCQGKVVICIGLLFDIKLPISFYIKTFLLNIQIQWCSIFWYPPSHLIKVSD